MGPDLGPRLPSHPGCNAEGSPEWPPQDLKRPPPPADPIRKADKKYLIPELLVAGSLLPRDRPGHRLQPCPVGLQPESADIAVHHQGTPMRMRKRLSQARARSGASRHSDGNRVLGNRLSAWQSRGPLRQCFGVGRRPPNSRRSSPRSRDFRSPTWRNQAEKWSSRASGMPRAIDPQGSPRCFRPAQTVLGCASLKAVPAGISR
ncbi:uncharacterized protein LOC116530833 [Sapajus apella]|uniref:Uncharacterized protein LOC116530833 n=1 Tax=Sapajus apella TaxID=9515 RepID=A0A6J3FH73_SAPAP|nr:uncharacterized protein LOC116530833 [Sapajus apella]